MSKESVLERARAAVNAIEREVNDRKGIGWSECDDDVQDEIRENLLNIVMKAITTEEA